MQLHLKKVYKANLSPGAHAYRLVAYSSLLGPVIGVLLAGAQVHSITMQMNDNRIGWCAALFKPAAPCESSNAKCAGLVLQ